jgi:hypothetical protein
VKACHLDLKQVEHQTFQKVKVQLTFSFQNKLQMATQITTHKQQLQMASV